METERRKEMNTPELQRLKMAWLAAKEAGNTQEQLSLLRDHPGEQSALIDFIAGYHATVGSELAEDAGLLPLTQQACQSALGRIFDAQQWRQAWESCVRAVV